MTVAWVDKEVTCYKTEWKERDVTCTVMRAHYKDVVETHKCNVCVPVWTDKKEKVWVCNMVAKEVVRDVTRCKMERTCCTDPCTGCTHTVCKPVTYVEQVKCTVWENHPLEKEVTVKVCSYKTEEKTYQSTHRVCEYKPEQVTYKERYCVSVPYKTTVKVAVCVPAPVCPPAPTDCK